MPGNGFKNLRVEGWRQFQSINIDLHPRLTIITGANATGKSTLLSFFSRHFGYSRNYLATPRSKDGKTLFSFGLFDWIRGLAEILNTPTATIIGSIEYINGGKSNLVLPASQGLHYSINLDHQQSIAGLHIDSHRPPNIYRPVTQFPATPPSAKGIGNGLNSEYMNYYASGSSQQGSLHHIKMTLILMSIFGHGNDTMEPMPELIELFAGFEEKLRTIFPKSLGFKKLTIKSPEVLLSTHSGDFLIDAASGGIIKLFEVAWQIYFFSQDQEDFVITFDEPENHLHPSMQKSFLPNIMNAFPKAQIIVVTHSPFIISAMKDSSVYVLRYEEYEYIRDNPNYNPYPDDSLRGLLGSRVLSEKLDTINKAGTASEILRDVLGIGATIPDWAEDRVTEIINEYKEKELDKSDLKKLYERLENEGLASSYPAAIANLTRPQ